MPKLQAPPGSGVTVRMYRQGHGDCFLLALPRSGESAGDGGEQEPIYVLIDCGLKPGSQDFVHGKSIGEVVDHIGESTGNRLDLMIVTHEHQDHVNGIWKKKDPYFERFEIGEAWLAWTEDPDDDLAEELRRRHRDQLLGLVAARHELALAAGEDDPTVSWLDTMLGLELGDPEELRRPGDRLGASDIEKSTNKQALKLVKDKAAKNHGVRYLRPGGDPLEVRGARGVRAYVLGPPRREDLLKDEDPVGDEAFPEEHSHGLSMTAAAKAQGMDRDRPFARSFALASGDALADGDGFFSRHYGRDGEGEDDRDRVEAPDRAAWRRIDGEWLYAAESLALKLNRGINNTSLVLAFELPVSKKILLFAGDAQRGNWKSWDDQTWQSDGKEVTAREILGRTVLYKVGHHGSHNATLAGREEDEYPNLAWMARGSHAGEFTAMITAVNEWAMTKNDPPWRHPLPSIREALVHKAQGRVFQTDIGEPEKPQGMSHAVWDAFRKRSTCEVLYFDYTVPDE